MTAERDLWVRYVVYAASALGGMLAMVVVVLMALTAGAWGQGVRPADDDSRDTSTPTDTSGDGDGEDWSYPEPTDEEEEAELRRRQQERDEWWAEHGTDRYRWTTPPRIRRDASDPWANDGALPAGPQHVRAWSGGRPSYGEVSAFDADFSSRNAWVSEWGNSTMNWDAWNASLAADEAWLASLPFIGKYYRKGAVDEGGAPGDLEAVGELIADEMPGDLAKANMGFISGVLSGVSEVAFNAASGRATARDFDGVLINASRPADSDLDSGAVMFAKWSFANAASAEQGGTFGAVDTE